MLEAIKVLGYFPNPHARRLSTGSSQLITVITPEMKGDFYQILMSAIDEVLFKYGYSSLLYPLYNEKKYEALKRSSDILLSTDGLIVDAVNVDKVLSNIIKPQTPVVCIEQESDDYDSIMVDNYYGGIIAGDYFADFDMDIFVVTHRKSHELESTVFDERLEGFQESLEKKVGVSIKFTTCPWTGKARLKLRDAYSTGLSDAPYSQQPITWQFQ